MLNKIFQIVNITLLLVLFGCTQIVEKRYRYDSFKYQDSDFKISGRLVGSFSESRIDKKTIAYTKGSPYELVLTFEPISRVKSDIKVINIRIIETKNGKNIYTIQKVNLKDNGPNNTSNNQFFSGSSKKFKMPYLDCSIELTIQFYKENKNDFIDKKLFFNCTKQYSETKSNAILSILSSA
jgi:hypothetical protein